MTSIESVGHKPIWKTVLIAGITAGVLDAVAASIMFYTMTGKGIDIVWRFVATGVFGPGAMAGGTSMVVAGLIFHFAIAMIWTTIFFLIYPRLGTFGKHWFLIGVIYGLIVWCGMNLVVVPLSGTPKSPFNWDGAIRNMIVLIFCVGTPVSWFAKKYYHSTKRLL